MTDIIIFNPNADPRFLLKSRTKGRPNPFEKKRSMISAHVVLRSFSLNTRKQLAAMRILRQAHLRSVLRGIRISTSLNADLQRFW